MKSMIFVSNKYMFTFNKYLFKTIQTNIYLLKYYY